MAHLTNFSFEFFYKIFTEDASQPLLYHGAKKSKMTKNSNQGGPASLKYSVPLLLTTAHLGPNKTTSPVRDQVISGSQVSTWCDNRTLIGWGGERATPWATTTHMCNHGDGDKPGKSSLCARCTKQPQLGCCGLPTVKSFEIWMAAAGSCSLGRLAVEFSDTPKRFGKSFFCKIVSQDGYHGLY